MQVQYPLVFRRGTALGLLVLLGTLFPGPVAPTVAQATVTAVVAGAPAVNVRKCPKQDCKALASAVVGEALTVTGKTVDGFAPVSYRGLNGYAFALYLARSDAPVVGFNRGAAGCNRIALAFNIGIGYEPDRSILDTLDRFDVPATMFVMGGWAEQNPKLLREMVDQGLVIGSHGNDAIELTLRSDAEIAADITTADAKIRAVIGDDLGPWFTPYAAAMDDRVRAIVAGQGYLPVGWEVPAADYGADATADGVWANVVPNAYDGAIVEMHFDGPNTAASTGTALPWVIDALTKRGYEFVTIPELTMPCDAS